MANNLTFLLQGKFSSGCKMSCGATPQKRNTCQQIKMNLCKKESFTGKIYLTFFKKMIKMCTLTYFLFNLVALHDIFRAVK